MRRVVQKTEMHCRRTQSGIFICYGAKKGGQQVFITVGDGVRVQCTQPCRHIRAVTLCCPCNSELPKSTVTPAVHAHTHTRFFCTVVAVLPPNTQTHAHMHTLTCDAGQQHDVAALGEGHVLLRLGVHPSDEAKPHYRAGLAQLEPGTKQQAANSACQVASVQQNPPESGLPLADCVQPVCWCCGCHCVVDVRSLRNWQPCGGAACARGAADQGSPDWQPCGDAACVRAACLTWPQPFTLSVELICSPVIPSLLPQ